VLTPDSSRFWNRDTYQVGSSPASYDKQFVRDWLKANNLAGSADIKEIPQDIVDKTAALYRECQSRLAN
jgi:phosphoribosylaminoimidazole-succinocarboxamide synthase